MPRREARRQEGRLDTPGIGSAAPENGNRSLMQNFYRKSRINVRISPIMSVAPSIPFFNYPVLFERDEVRRISDLIHAFYRGQE